MVIKHKPIADTVSEASLIGAMILEPKALLAAREAGVTDADFYSEAHAHLFRALRDMFTTREAGDLVLLQATLRQRGVLEAVGGIDYLESLACTTPGAVNAPHYAQIVSQMGRTRRLAECLESVAYKVRTQSMPLEEAVQVIADRLARSTPSLASEETQIGDAARVVLEDIRAQKPRRYPFGFDSMDNDIGGIPTVGVVVIMGVPGSGKSSLALQIAHSISKAGHGVRVFSYEMASQQVAVNLLASLSSVNVSFALRTGNGVGEYEEPLLEQRANDLAMLDMAVIDHNVTATEILEKCRVYAAKGVRCIVVDYVQNLPGLEGQDDTRRIEGACRTLQRVARDLNMLVLLVSQMTGAAQREDRPPRKSDGLGSAAIDQVADMTIGVYRPCVFTPKGKNEPAAMWEARKRECQLHILKNKQGSLGAFPVSFEGRYTRFYDMEYDIQEGAPQEWQNSPPTKSRSLGASSASENFFDAANRT